MKKDWAANAAETCWAMFCEWDASMPADQIIKKMAQAIREHGRTDSYGDIRTFHSSDRLAQRESKK